MEPIEKLYLKFKDIAWKLKQECDKYDMCGKCPMLLEDYHCKLENIVTPKFGKTSYPGVWNVSKEE